MGQLAEPKGLISSSCDYREENKLVKIFTESSGRMMFYIKRIRRQNQPLAPALLPFAKAVHISNFRNEGLSFLGSVKDVHAFRNIQEDIFLSGYGTYLLNLADAAIGDHQYDPHLFQFTQQALQRMDQGDDIGIVTNILEVQILQYFGITPIWTHCVVYGETKGKFDYSFKSGGVICEKHWPMDEHRYHADPRAVYFVQVFSAISYDKISGAHLKEETEQVIRDLINQLCGEYIGTHLKSKKFINQMKSWTRVLKTPEGNISKKEIPEKEE